MIIIFQIVPAHNITGNVNLKKEKKSEVNKENQKLMFANLKWRLWWYYDQSCGMPGITAVLWYYSCCNITPSCLSKRGKLIGHQSFFSTEHRCENALHVLTCCLSPTLSKWIVHKLLTRPKSFYCLLLHWRHKWIKKMTSCVGTRRTFSIEVRSIRRQITSRVGS